MQKFYSALLAILGFISFSAYADVTSATQAAKNYGIYAKNQNPDSKLSAEAGRAFYTKKIVVDGKDLSCSACHTDNPANKGKHNETGNVIQPMAPSANPKRFADLNKSEKGFTKHCRDLYKHDCSAQDKGDFVTYLLSVK
jgi:hypothetical protein